MDVNKLGPGADVGKLAHHTFCLHPTSFKQLLFRPPLLASLEACGFLAVPSPLKLLEVRGPLHTCLGLQHWYR